LLSHEIDLVEETGDEFWSLACAPMCLTVPEGPGRAGKEQKIMEEWGEE
jgi:hypothetical protein